MAQGKRGNPLLTVKEEVFRQPSLSLLQAFRPNHRPYQSSASFGLRRGSQKINEPQGYWQNTDEISSLT